MKYAEIVPGDTGWVYDRNNVKLQPVEIIAWSIHNREWFSYWCPVLQCRVSTPSKWYVKKCI